MKKMLAVVGLFIGACVIAQAGYRTEATVTPASEAHQYVVRFKIMDVAKDGKTDVLSAPQIIVKAGQEGKAMVADEKGLDGVFCTAIIKEIEGGVEAVTTVVVKEKGEEVLSTAQTVIVSTRDLTRAITAPEYGPNLYWPGDFEARFEGGNFGSMLGNMALSTETNRTPGGRQSWRINAGYQHLELLVPSFSKGVLSFWALATRPQTLVFKVVDPLPGVLVTRENPARTHDQTLTIPASSDWQRHEIAFEAFNSWPKPPVSEILITFYNQDGDSVFIDDLEVRMAPDASPAPKPGRPVAAMPDATFFENLTFGTEAPHKTSAFCSLNADDLRGHRVRISADVTYLSMDGDIQNWGSILFSIVEGQFGAGQALDPIGEWPFWAPIGHAAPVGAPRRISAEYHIPADAYALQFQVMAQPGLGRNTARIDNIHFEVLDPPTGANP